MQDLFPASPRLSCKRIGRLEEDESFVVGDALGGYERWNGLLDFVVVGAASAHGGKGGEIAGGALAPNHANLLADAAELDGLDSVFGDALNLSKDDDLAAIPVSDARRETRRLTPKECDHVCGYEELLVSQRDFHGGVGCEGQSDEWRWQRGG